MFYLWVDISNVWCHIWSRRMVPYMVTGQRLDPCHVAIRNVWCHIWSQAKPTEPPKPTGNPSTIQPHTKHTLERPRIDSSAFLHLVLATVLPYLTRARTRKMPCSTPFFTTEQAYSSSCDPGFRLFLAIFGHNR